MKIKHKHGKKILLILIIVLILLLGGVGYFFFIHENKSLYPATTTTQSGQKTTSDPNVPGGTTKLGEDSQNGQPIDKEGSTDEPELDPTIQPSNPTGLFVSNHRPNLSGQPTPNALSSVCTTTPGASCKLQFRMGNTLKELPVKKTDATGSVQWNWTLQEVGLSQGTWTITAVALNGAKTATTTDSISLEVRP